MAKLHKFGTILSGHSLAISLKALQQATGTDVTIGELATLLNLHWQDIHEAILGDKRNDDIFDDYYQALRGPVNKMGGSLPSLAGIRKMGRDDRIRLIQHDIGALGSHAADLRHFILPGETIFLPHNPEFEKQLKEERRAGRISKFTQGDFVFLIDTTKQLAHHAQELRKLLDRKRKIVQEHQLEVHVLGKMSALAALQKDNWPKLSGNPEKNKEHRDHRMLLDSVAAQAEISQQRARQILVRQIDDQMPKKTKLAGQTSHARNLLEILGNEEFARQMSALSRVQSMISAERMDTLVEAIEMACVVLLESPLSNQFQRDHLVPMLESFHEGQMPGLAGAAHVLKDAKFKDSLLNDAPKLLKELKGTYKPSSSAVSSALVGFARFAKITPAVSSVVTSSLKVASPQIIDRLNAVFGNETGTLGRRYSTFLLRTVAQVSRFDMDGELSLQQRIKIAQVLGAFNETDPHRRAAKIRDLEVDLDFASGRLGSGLSALVNVAVFLSVCTKKGAKANFENVMNAVAAFVSAVGSTTDFVAKMVAKFDDTVEAAATVADLEAKAAAISRFATMAGIIVTSVHLSGRIHHQDHFGIGMDVLGLVGSTLSLAGWAFALEGTLGFCASLGVPALGAGLAALAPWLVAAGAVIGAVVLFVQIWQVIKDTSPQGLFKAYFEHLNRKDGPFLDGEVRSKLESELLEVKRRFDMANGVAGGLALSSFARLSVGSSVLDAVLPARLQGFEFDELLAIFDVAPAALITVVPNPSYEKAMKKAA